MGCWTSLGQRGRSSVWLSLLLVVASTQALAARCLYVSSYHAGYEWNDGIERGLERGLAGHCEIERFYMDTKRQRSDSDAERAGRAAHERIRGAQPDVVIACDDAAARYLVMPFYRDAALPVVVCGINMTAEPYGMPYRNVSGMVEVAPIKPLIEILAQARPSARRGVYLAPDVLSQAKEFELNRRLYAKAGIALEPAWVRNFGEWQSAFRRAQAADLVVLASNGGLDDWDDSQAVALVAQATRTLTVTNMDWMSRYAAIAVTKDAQEQGEWAAEVARAVLQGQQIGNIPMVVNRRWHLLVNDRLIAQAQATLPNDVKRKAVKVELD